MIRPLPPITSHVKRTNLTNLNLYRLFLSAARKGTIFFVSDIDKSTCAFVDRCAHTCGQQSAAPARWSGGTLTNRGWTALGNELNNTYFLPSGTAPSFIVCLSNTTDVLNEVQSMCVPSLCFSSISGREAKHLVAYYSTLIRKHHGM